MKPPGELTSVAIAALPGGALAQVVINDRTECLARLHADGAWSAWHLVASGARDVSVTAGASQGELSALIAVVVLVPLPIGSFAAGHAFHQGAFYRLTVSGITPAGLHAPLTESEPRVRI